MVEEGEEEGRSAEGKWRGGEEEEKGRRGEEEDEWRGLTGGRGGGPNNEEEDPSSLLLLLFVRLVSSPASKSIPFPKISRLLLGEKLLLSLSRHESVVHSREE